MLWLWEFVTAYIIRLNESADDTRTVALIASAQRLMGDSWRQTCVPEGAVIKLQRDALMIEIKNTSLLFTVKKGRNQALICGERTEVL